MVQIHIVFCEYVFAAKPPSVHRNFAQKPEVAGMPTALSVKIKLKAASFGVRLASAPINGNFVVLNICDTKQKHKNSPREIKDAEMH